MTSTSPVSLVRDPKTPFAVPKLFSLRLTCVVDSCCLKRKKAGTVNIPEADDSNALSTDTQKATGRPSVSNGPSIERAV
jgi:hypothetical protein